VQAKPSAKVVASAAEPLQQTPRHQIVFNALVSICLASVELLVGMEE
jgi:hypothetical protein